MGFRDRKQLIERWRGTLKADHGSCDGLNIEDYDEALVTIFENEIGYDPDASEFAGETAFVVPVAPPPAPSRRPTRAEAISMAEGMVEGRESCLTSEIVVAVAALFGGFAPEPIEVPKLVMDGAGNTHIAPDGDYASREIRSALIERSNAWEKVKGLALDALAIASQPFEGNGDGRDLEIGKLLGDIVSAMNRPEMGIGPTEES